jgi:hypothetical protein
LLIEKELSDYFFPKGVFQLIALYIAFLLFHTLKKFNFLNYLF